MLALGEAPYIHLPNNNSLRTHVKGLHERALRHCIVVLRMVMDIVKSHIDLAQSSPFFAYDVALIRDACFSAPILLATIDYDLYASEDELRRDIDLCIHATRSMRFAYRRSSDRERSIETLWDLRCHRLHHKRAQGQPPPLALTASNLVSPSRTPPALYAPIFSYPQLARMGDDSASNDDRTSPARSAICSPWNIRQRSDHTYSQKGSPPSPSSFHSSGRAYEIFGVSTTLVRRERRG
jgi:hypothetical protein